VEVAFNVLGPLQVVINGVEVAIPAPKERALLAMLVVNHGHTVSVERLTEELWPSLDADRARRALQVRAAAVRKLFNDAGSLLEFVAPGYRLAVAAADIDEHRFFALVERARCESQDADWAAAAATLRSALSLWRGEPLADVQAGVRLEAETARLAEARLGAIEDRIDADLACGGHRALVSELEGLVAVHPLRERLWSQRILALYRTGRQADALGAYQTLRQQLADELGLEPGPELARLEHEILGHAPSLDWSPARRRRAGRDSLVASNLPDQREPLRFVGRGAERDELAAWWDESSLGARLALVSGEAGVGKTRLVTTFARELERGGSLVLYGRAAEAGGSAYEPVIGALRHFVVSADDEVIDAFDETAAAAISRLVPEMAERRPVLAARASAWGEVDRSWLLGAVAECFADSGGPPVLMVLDGLQWADRAALLLLSRLAEPGRRVRILGTYRTAGRAPTAHLSELQAEMRHDDRPMTHIALEGLSRDDVAELVSVLTDTEPPDAGHAFVADLHRRTNGNPFFVHETLRQLETTGAISVAGGRWGVDRPLGDLGIPEGIRDVVGLRLAPLSADARDVLRAGAIMGTDFDVDVLAAVLGRDDGYVVSALDEALAAGLVHEDLARIDRYGFSHALIHEVVVAELSRSRRIRLERRTAEALETLRPTELDELAGELARHFVAGAAVGDALKAADYSLRAAARAREHVAWEEAVNYYEMALGALERSGEATDEQRADMLIMLGSAANRAGNVQRWREACLEAARVARRVGDADRLAAAAISLLGTLGPGPDDVVIALIEQAIDALRSSVASPIRLALIAELLARLSGHLANTRPDRSEELAGEALETARRAEDERTLALALVRSTQTYALERDEHQARLREATRLAEASGDLEVVLEANSGLMAGALIWADRDEFDRRLREYARVANVTRSSAALVVSAIDHAGAAALDGRYEQAREQFGDALRRAAALADPSLRGDIRAGLAPVDREQGRLSWRVERTRQVAAARVSTPSYQVALIRRLCEAGELAEATEHLDAILVRPETVLTGFLRRFNLANLAEAADILGHRDVAGLLYRWLEDELRRGDCIIVGPSAYFGAVHRYLGLLALTLGRAPDAVNHHEAAMEVHERMRARGWAARSRYDLARALLARNEEGDNSRAAHLLDTAAHIARQLTMPKLLDEVLAVQHGADSGRPPPPSVGGPLGTFPVGGGGFDPPTARV
jgi:DNA-binding SARP family transcriptional activator